MSNQLEILRTFVHDEPVNILRRLHERTQAKTELDDLAFVDVTLGHRTMSGLLIRLDEGTTGPIVMLAETDGGSKDIKAIAYLRAADVLAVSIRNHNRFVKALARNAGVSGAARPAPTKLGIKRSAREFEASLLATHGLATEFAIDWERIPDSEEALLGLADFLDSLNDSILQIAGNALGKDALSAIARWHIAHAAGRPLSVEKRSGDLSLSLDLEDFDAPRASQGITTSIETVI